MDQTQRSSFMGPALFFGLIIYTVLSQNMVPVSYLNPAETMDMVAAAQPTTLAKAAEPIAPYIVQLGPVRHQPRPTDFTLTRATGARAYARITRPAPTARQSVAGGQAPVALVQVGSAPAFDVAIPAQDTPAPIAVQSQPLPRGAADITITAPIHDWVIVGGDFVNLRSGPGINFPSITQVDTGVRVLRVDTDGRWSQVSLLTQDQRLSGWIASTYLRSESP